MELLMGILALAPLFAVFIIIPVVVFRLFSNRAKKAPPNSDKLDALATELTKSDDMGRVIIAADNYKAYIGQATTKLGSAILTAEGISFYGKHKVQRISGRSRHASYVNEKIPREDINRIYVKWKNTLRATLYALSVPWLIAGLMSAPGIFESTDAILIFIIALILGGIPFLIGRNLHSVLYFHIEAKDQNVFFKEKLSKKVRAEDRCKVLNLYFEEYLKSEVTV